ncbi:MAG: DUF2520 domain-containing protein [Acidobacteria bacterium]|nr:DUF2520 domain-containing protein [Acidobacteriota bacterium]
MSENAVSFLGTGKVGTILARALVRRGYPIGGLYSRCPSSAQESRRLIGEGKVFSRPEDAAEQGNIVFLTVADDAIAPVAAELAGARLSWNDRIVFHCSGLLSSSILEPLEQRGALTASLHPVQSFVHKNQNLSALENIFYGLEGHPRAVETAREIVDRLRGTAFDLSGVNRPAYHAACSLSSNFFVTLLETAAGILESNGFSPELSIKILTPLMQGTLQNVNIFGAAASLSGPLVRGDIISVRAHLKALKMVDGTAESFYRQLALHSLETLEKAKNLPPKTIRALKNLLEDK